jgi:hypothetical protein
VSPLPRFHVDVDMGCARNHVRVVNHPDHRVAAVHADVDPVKTESCVKRYTAIRVRQRPFQAKSEHTNVFHKHSSQRHAVCVGQSRGHDSHSLALVAVPTVAPLSFNHMTPSGGTQVGLTTVPSPTPTDNAFTREQRRPTSRATLPTRALAQGQL